MRKLALLTVIGVYNGVNSSIYAKHIKVATRYLLIATLGVQEALPVLFPSECTTVHAVEMYVSQSYSIGESENSQEIKIYQGFGALKGKPPAKGGGDRTGSYLWHGGVELGTTLARKELVNVEGKRVIDLGTGTGVVGIAAVFEGAKEVALTDGAQEIVEIAAINIRRNFPSLQSAHPPAEPPTIITLSGQIVQKHQKSPTEVAVGRLRWDSREDIDTWLGWNPDKEADGKYDIVLASEVFYQRQSIDKLLRTMKSLVRPQSEGGRVVLRLTRDLTDEARGFDSYLLPRIKQLGFDILLAPSDKNNETDDDASELIVCALKTP